MPAGVERLLDLLSDASSTETRIVPAKEGNSKL